MRPASEPAKARTGVDSFIKQKSGPRTWPAIVGIIGNGHSMLVPPLPPAPPEPEPPPPPPDPPPAPCAHDVAAIQQQQVAAMIAENARILSSEEGAAPGAAEEFRHAPSKRRPLAIDLFCGLGGWAEGLLAEGWEVIGFDVERHLYGQHRYPAQLVIQDVLSLSGAQFRDAGLIVASPPCQEYSYMAMPWKRAKAKAKAIRADETGQMLADLNRLFNACFQIQAQASFAARRQIPLIVESVRGAQPWVGRARWNFGSFYLWGDVPALMPITKRIAKVGGLDWNRYGQPGYRGEAFNTHAERKLAGLRFDGSGRSFQSETVGRKGVPHPTAGHWSNPNDPAHGFGWDGTLLRQRHSHGHARKAASAMIAKIPLPLATHIARVFRDA